jgi:hypothetical protein
MELPENSTIEIAAGKKKLNRRVKFNHNIPEASKQARKPSSCFV